MKKTKILLLLFTVLFFSINGCKKDEQEEEDVFGNEVYLLSQQDVIDFGAKGYENFDGNLWIGDTREGGYHINTSIVDLTPLHNLKTVNELNILSNANLTSLHGLENLEIISNQLNIHTNYALTDLSALNNCTINKFLFIIDNDALTNIDDLQNCNLSGLNCIGVYDNNLLENIDGFSSIDTLSTWDSSNGSCITIKNNNSLTNLDGLSNLTSIHTSFIISGNIVLTDFCGLRNCLINNTEDFTVIDNAYNPTKQDIINGNCNQ